MTQLSINLNKIALIRNARDTTQPDPCEFAASVIQAGAHGITVHPRPDQRHIRAEDCVRLSAMNGTELNIEGNPFAAAQSAPRAGIGDYPGFLALIERIRPEQVTLVPDSDDQLTSDHGFDITRDGDRLHPIIEQLKGWGCRVSLYSWTPIPRKSVWCEHSARTALSSTPKPTLAPMSAANTDRHSLNFRRRQLRRRFMA